MKLVYYQSFEEYDLAIRWEKKIKKWSKAKKEALINGDWTLVKKLAECKNQTSHRFFNKDRNKDK